MGATTQGSNQTERKLKVLCAACGLSYFPTEPGRYSCAMCGSEAEVGRSVTPRAILVRWLFNDRADDLADVSDDVRALVARGWKVEPCEGCLWPDSAGVDGWRWTSPDGDTFDTFEGETPEATR